MNKCDKCIHKSVCRYLIETQQLREDICKDYVGTTRNTHRSIKCKLDDIPNLNYRHVMSLYLEGFTREYIALHAKYSRRQVERIIHRYR